MRSSTLWALAGKQHGVVSHAQLVELGLSRPAIKHRLAKGRLHPVRRGEHLWREVYAIGRPQLSRRGIWMAAVLISGPRAALSHQSAAALWGILEREGSEIEVSVPYPLIRRRPGILVHRRRNLVPEDLTRCQGIPVTSPACTIIDLAARIENDQVEAAVNEADKRDLIDPEALRSALDLVGPRPGVRRLRRILDRRTFTLTDSELERLFLPIVRKAGLPAPQTQRHVNGFRVDFFWPDLGLVVETDGLRYHRTPAEQARDRVRDQAHAAAGLTPLRFTRAQVRYDPNHVEATLRAVASRLGNDARERG